MAKFTQTTGAALIAATIAGLAGCNETEKAPSPPKPTTFTVGGSVAGLAGGGLVLQLNGANDLVINASGKFNFPKPLNKGSAYAVTVKTSPAAPVKQTCAVSQGSGNIAAAVNNVAVTCTTNNFAVGGTVTGLSGKGLALQLNGTHDVAIDKNGDFVFPGVQLPDGSDYSVAIKAVPAKQECTIKPVNIAPDDNTLNIVAVTCAKKGHRK